MGEDFEGEAESSLYSPCNGRPKHDRGGREEPTNGRGSRVMAVVAGEQGLDTCQGHEEIMGAVLDRLGLVSLMLCGLDSKTFQQV